MSLNLHIVAEQSPMFELRIHFFCVILSGTKCSEESMNLIPNLVRIHKKTQS